MNTFFTSDTHFWHTNIITYCDRPWDSVEAMNEGLVERWNSVVQPDDFVWVLGDYDMNGKDKALAILGRLNGSKGLIEGNHDKAWVGNNISPIKLGNNQRRYLEAGFEFVVPFAQTKIAGTEVMLSHFPYAGDSHDKDRYDWFRLKDEGRWLLHGHTHNPEQRLHDGKQIHVGADAWDYTPVHEDTIAELMY